MSGTNREGPLVTVGNIRSSIIEHANTTGWLNYYLAEAERAEGLTEGTIERPRSWKWPTEVMSWPDDQRPAVLVVIGETEGEPVEYGEGLVQASWNVEMSAVVRGVDENDTEQQASVYSAALRAFVAKQGLRLPDLTVEGARWRREAYGDLPQQGEFARSLRMAGVGFTLTLSDVVSTVPGVTEIPVPPLGDPGPYPAVDTVIVSVEQMGD